MAFRRAVLLLAALSPLSSTAVAGDGKVSGLVTHRGKPVEAAAIYFHIGGGEFVGAKIKADGKYAVSRVPEGTWTVTVEGKGVPAKYATEAASALKVEVKGGKLAFDLVLD